MILFEENGDVSISAGFGQLIDDLGLQGPCEMNQSGQELHQMDQCSSTLHLMQLHYDLILEIYTDPERIASTIHSGKMLELNHLIDRHLLPVLLRIEEEFWRLGDEFLNEFQTAHVLFFAFESVLNVVITLVSAIYVYTLHGCYGALLRLMHRVSPVHILASEDLEGYLLGVEISTHERIINISQNCMGATAVIEMVNPAVPKTFGYTSEQVLSLPFTTLINEDNAEKISRQMSLMANHQSSAVFEGHTVCTAEDQSEIPCSIIILASLIDGHIAQFVAILKDESALMHQQQAAKQQIENLLSQISRGASPHGSTQARKISDSLSPQQQSCSSILSSSANTHGI
jgi:PAS domain S-box-containing protein